MNIASVNYNSIENGPGIRHAVFVSGCPFHCQGCHNREAWDYSFGEKYTGELCREILDRSDSPYIAGLTLLGGEPLCPENYGDILELARAFRERFPNKSIWCYTGYLYEEVMDKEIMEYIDVLVDGPFVLDQRDLRLKFKGSANQRIIDVAESRKTGKVCLLDV